MFEFESVDLPTMTSSNDCVDQSFSVGSKLSICRINEKIHTLLNKIQY